MFKATKKYQLFIFLLLLALMQTVVADAHTVNYVLEKAPTSHVIWYYIKLGFLHIIPQGLDHILFVAGLCLLSNKMSVILWQATAFTIAHSITLALSMKGMIVAPPAIVEPIIALSILFVAIENILLKELKPWRVILVFLFGLVHGLGFASSLNEIGLPRNQFITSILSFNVGVELGQFAIILLVFGLLVFPFGKWKLYRSRIVYPLSTVIGCFALYWTVERILLI
jgi:hypothetical protein